MCMPYDGISARQMTEGPRRDFRPSHNRRRHCTLQCAYAWTRLTSLVHRFPEQRQPAPSEPATIILPGLITPMVAASLLAEEGAGGGPWGIMNMCSVVDVVVYRSNTHLCERNADVGSR